METNINEITEKIIGAAIVVHKELDPGLLESAYEACIAYELTQNGLNFERQKGLPPVTGELIWIVGIELTY